MHIVLDGGGSFYKVPEMKVTKEGTIAPAFSRKEDVELWRSLNNKRFKEIIILLEDE